jgi:hypothetical protein
VLEDQRIADINYGIDMLGGGRGKGGINFLGRGGFDYQQNHAQVPGRAGHIFGYYQPVDWVARIDQERNFRGARNQFPEDLNAFREEILRYHGRKTRGVASWSWEALDEAKANGIGHSHEDNRDSSSCRFQGCGCLRAGANEQIGLEGDKFGGESRDALGMTFEVSVINDQVLALDPAVIAEGFVKHFENLQILEAAE